MAESSQYKMEARSLGPGNLQASPGDHTHDGITSKSLTTWIDYTPSWTATTTSPTLNNGTLIGQYFIIGSIVTFKILLVIGSTTSVGSGGYILTLPVAATSDYPLKTAIGQGSLYDVSSLAYRLYYPVIDTVGTSSIQLLSDTGGTWASTIPWTPAVGDTITVLGNYEKA